MRIAMILIALCFGASVAFGQKPIDPAYQIRIRRSGLIVTFQGKAHRFNLGGRIDAARVSEIELLFAAEKDAFRYLVIDVSGGSREKRNDRQCGAGTESNLIWLKLDASWKILDVKSVRYQSCWSATELNDAWKITKTTLRADFDNIRDRLNVKLFYNAEEPEKGFQISETEIKEISSAGRL